MKEHEVIVGEFENELYTEIAERELRAAGINANILKVSDGGMFKSLQKTDGVQLLVTDIQEEKAKKILQTKFI